MNEFEVFTDDLLEQSKRFLEKAKTERDIDAVNAYLNASLLLSVSSLEAFMNGIAEDFFQSKNFDILENAFLSEKEIELKNGVFQITKRINYPGAELRGMKMLYSNNFN